MQQASVKERVMFYPISFEKLDGVIRHGFVPGVGVGGVGGGSMPVGDIYSNQAAAFYPDSDSANQLFQSKLYFLYLHILRSII